MSQSKIILLVVGVVIAGGLWFMLQGGAGEDASTQNDATPQATESDAAFTGVGSFTALMDLGKNIRCEFSYNDESGEGSGASYFADDRMRVDSTQSVDGETMTAHMVNDGEYVYTWTDGAEESFAMKMPVKEIEGSPQEYTGIPTEAEQNMIESDQEVEYDCDRWRVDESTFVPPNGITFMDMEAMLENMKENMPEGFEMPEGVPVLQ